MFPCLVIRTLPTSGPGRPNLRVSSSLPPFLTTHIHNANPFTLIGLPHLHCNVSSVAFKLPVTMGRWACLAERPLIPGEQSSL